MLYDYILKNFVPIVFPPGHMGNFLINFISPIKHYEIPFEKHGYMLRNTEWDYRDAVDNLFLKASTNPELCIPNCTMTYYLDIKDPEELIKTSIISTLNIKYHLLRKQNFPYDVITKESIKDPEVQKILHDPYNSQYQLPIEVLKQNSYIFLKQHTYSYVYTKKINDIIPWSKIPIFADFPMEKSWLPFILLIYKLFYMMDKLDDGMDKGSAGFYYKAKKVYARLDETFGTWHRNAYYSEYNKSLYQCIDMYDLLVNGNIDQIYKIDPNFEFTEKKQTILKTAQQTLHDAINLFRIDLDFNVEQHDSVIALCKNPMLVKLIKVMAYKMGDSDMVRFLTTKF
jgi:hypothetical protein